MKSWASSTTSASKRAVEGLRRFEQKLGEHVPVAVAVLRRLECVSEPGLAWPWPGRARGSGWPSGPPRAGGRLGEEAAQGGVEAEEQRVEPLGGEPTGGLDGEDGLARARAARDWTRGTWTSVRRSRTALPSASASLVRISLASAGVERVSCPSDGQGVEAPARRRPCRAEAGRGASGRRSAARRGRRPPRPEAPGHPARARGAWPARGPCLPSVTWGRQTACTRWS